MTDGDFFETIYRNAGGDRDRLGWTRHGPDPMLAAWLEGESRIPGRAIVVACGVGDDAEYLSSRGWEVTAFDISPTAIEWCRERFPDSKVDYRVADLFALPADWNRAFDLVVEVWTIQSIPPRQSPRAISAIAELVGDGGTLLVSTLTSTDDESRHGPPWPVRPETLGGFIEGGLAVATEVEGATPYPSVGKLEIEYARA